MEQSNLVDATLRIYGRLRESGRDAVGCVLQSYLYRTPADLEALLPVAPNLRLVKGAYLEPPEIAYPRKQDVDAAYVRLLERALLGGAYLAVATHDERLIAHTIRFTEQHGIGRDRYEFQMLYGVRPQLQLDLVGRGYNVLVATPYGPGVVPVPDAAARRAAGELAVRRPQPAEVKDLPEDFDVGALAGALADGWGLRRRGRRLRGARRRELPLGRARRRGSARLRHRRRPRPEGVARGHARCRRSTASAARSTPPPPSATPASPSSSRRSARRGGESLRRIGPRHTVALFPFVDGRAGECGDYDAGRARRRRRAARRAPSSDARGRVGGAQRRSRAARPRAHRGGAPRRGRAVVGRTALRAGAARTRRVTRPTWPSCSPWPTVSPPTSTRAAASGWSRTASRTPPTSCGPATGHVLVDWDTVALAPPERDLWMVMGETDDEQPSMRRPPVARRWTTSVSPGI